MKLSEKLEKMQERALRFVFNDFSSSYVVLLKKASKSSLYMSRIRMCAEQTYKILNNLSPPISQTFFDKSTNAYTFRDTDRIVLPNYNTITHGKNSFHYNAATIWNKLPLSIKQSNTLEIFKQHIKTWKGPTCKCNNCLVCKYKF